MSATSWRLDRLFRFWSRRLSRTRPALRSCKPVAREKRETVAYLRQRLRPVGVRSWLSRHDCGGSAAAGCCCRETPGRTVSRRCDCGCWPLAEDDDSGRDHYGVAGGRLGDRRQPLLIFTATVELTPGALATTWGVSPAGPYVRSQRTILASDGLVDDIEQRSAHATQVFVGEDELLRCLGRCRIRECVCSPARHAAWSGLLVTVGWGTTRPCFISKRHFQMA